MPRGGKRERSGRPSPWKHTKTQLIRVPEEFAEEVLKFARKLDEKKSSGDQDAISGQMSINLDFSKGLTQADLSRRFGVHSSSTRKFRLEQTPEKFADWTRRKDPDGFCWQYDDVTKRYYQVFDEYQ